MIYSQYIYKMLEGNVFLKRCPRLIFIGNFLCYTRLSKEVNNLKKWLGFWIIVLLVLIVVYHEEPPKLAVMDEYEELYGFKMQEPYAQETVFANKVDEMEFRDYVRVYSYDEGRSVLGELLKGKDPVVSLDVTKQDLQPVTAENAQMVQEKIDFMTLQMKKTYLLPDGKNIHEIFDERVPKAADADYYFFNETTDGNFYIALYFEETGQLHTIEWRN